MWKERVLISNAEPKSWKRNDRKFNKANTKPILAALFGRDEHEINNFTFMMNKTMKRKEKQRNIERIPIALASSKHVLPLSIVIRIL